MTSVSKLWFGRRGLRQRGKRRHRTFRHDGRTRWRHSRQAGGNGARQHTDHGLLR